MSDSELTKTDNPLDPATQRQIVRERYARFEQLDIIPKDDSVQFIREWDDEYDVSSSSLRASLVGAEVIIDE